MKKLFIILALACATVPALAQHRHHGNHGHWQHRHHGYYGNSWVAPLVIGGIVTYSLTRPEPVIVQQPVIVQPNPTVLQNPTCTPWTETHSSDGTITRTRTCTQ
jgi:hypothetical protein